MNLCQRLSWIEQTCLLLWCGVGVAAQQPGDREVSAKRLEDDVVALSSIQPPRNHAHKASLDRAATFVETRFRSLGGDVDIQTFEVDSVQYCNVSISFGPEDRPRIVVGAHYDVCGEQPGADDNASGVAGVLELARLLDECQPVLNYRIELVAYTLEEPPFFRTEAMGSHHHARRLADKGTNVELMISTEMIGFFTDAPHSQSYPVFFLDWFYPDVGNYVAVVGKFGQGDVVDRVSELMESASAIPVSSISAPGFIPGMDFSDHLNYWKFGFDAVMITDTAFLRNPHYHRPTDTPQTLDYRKMAGVVRGLYETITRW